MKACWKYRAAQSAKQIWEWLQKPKNIATVVALAVSWVLFALNTGNADYKNYEYAYQIFGEGAPNEYFEPLFYGLMMACYWCGLPYQGFVVVIATITLTIFVKAIRFFSKDLLWVWLVFMIYPFAFDIVQYRNFLAFAICLYGMHYLLKETPGIWDIVKYILFVAVGALIHKSMVVYLVFLLIRVNKTKHVAILSGFAFMGVGLLALFGERLISLLGQIRPGAFGLNAFTRYWEGLNLSTFVQYFAVYIFFLALAVLKYRGRYEERDFKLIVAVSLLVPFIIMSGTAARFFRNMFVVFYALLLHRSEGRGAKELLRDRIIAAALVSCVVFVFYMQLGSGLYHEIVLLPVLKENLLFGFGR